MDEIIQTTEQKKKGLFPLGSMYPAGLMIIIGVYFLLNNFGIVSGDSLSKLWPLLIIVPALISLFSLKRQ